MAEPVRKRCLIIGAGAIGSVLAHYLQAARHEVRFVVRPQELSAYQNEAHLRIERTTRAPALTSTAPALSTRINLDAVDYAFICVKHPDLQSVIDGMPRPLPDSIHLVSCLNGVGIARRLRSEFEHAHVSTMTIMFNAQLIEPMHAQITTRPVVYLDTEDKTLPGLFRGTDLQVRRAAGESAAWGKLLINLNNALCALTNTTFRDVLNGGEMTALFAALIDEAVNVLDHAAIRYSLIVPIPYKLYRWLLHHAGRLPWWVGRLTHGVSARSYPSMVADIRLGRPTEIDQLNGEIVRLGEQVGVETPYNRRVVELIKAWEGKPRDVFMTPRELAQELGVPLD